MFPTTSPARARTRHRLLAAFAVTIASVALAPAAALAADGRIAFTHHAADGSQKIMSVGADGTGLTEVTTSFGAGDTDPTWSPR
jgi:hypothetical protein